MQTDLGKVSVTPKGNWSSATEYEILDIVTNAGNAYIARKDVPAGTAITNTDYWYKLVDKGDKGDTGEITGASATIDNTFGIPSITVTSGGTSSERTFTFAFQHLKGNGIVSVEKTSTEGNVDTYTIAYDDDSTTTFTVTNGSVTSVNGRTGDVTGLANIDGYYGATGLGAYTAEQLIASVSVRDKTPYLFRVTAGGYDTGVLQSGNVVGGTICWNQLVAADTAALTLVSGKKYLCRIGGEDSVVSGTGQEISVAAGDQVHDLTHMFGAAVAAKMTAEIFRKYFPKTDYAYNPGELLSVKTSAHVLTGFNAYNPTTGTAKLVGGELYQITGSYTALTYSTGETVAPDATGHFTPTADGILTVTGGNATDTCVHLSHSGYRDGEWEPFLQNSYPLDADLELRGVPKLDSANRLYYDGDIYQPDGTVKIRYNRVDLGNLNWVKTGNYVYASSNPKKVDNGGEIPNMICSRYYTGSRNQAFSTTTSSNNNIISSSYNGSGRQILVKDSRFTNMTAAEIKADLAGVIAVFEKETPTSASADPFQSPQTGDDFGTEEFVDERDVPIPVGHDTSYQANLRDKLQRLPDIPAQDGTYLVSISGGQASFMRYSAATELPTPPTEDGKYTLRTVIVDGTPTIQWEKEVE